MILAAGLGTRLLPLTENLAKPAIPVVNTPLILYSLHLLQRAGIQEVMINLHHAPQSIKKLLGRGGKWKMKIRYSHEPQILGTGGGLKAVQDYFAREECFVLINGDVICDLDLEKAISFHQDVEAVATMVLRADARAEQYGVIGVDAQNRIRRFTDLVPSTNTALRKTLFTGIHILSPRIFEYLPPAIAVCINRYAYPRMLENHEPVFGYLMDGYWADLGTINAYLETNLSLIGQPNLLKYFNPLELFSHAPKKEVDRVIRIGKEVNLMEDARLLDPVVVGDGCEIRKGAIVGPHVILGNGCLVEENCRLEHAVVWPETKIPKKTTLKREIVNKKIRIPIPQENELGARTTL